MAVRNRLISSLEGRPRSQSQAPQSQIDITQPPPTMIASKLLPPIYDSGVDPALQNLSLVVVFAKLPGASTKKKIETAIPPPLRYSVRWIGELLHVCTVEYNEVDIRRAYDPKVRAYVEKHGKALHDDAVRCLVQETFDNEATKASLKAFWRDVGHWFAMCDDAAPIVFVDTSAPLEIPGYQNAEKRGRMRLVEVMVPRLTAMLRRGVTKGDYLPSNIAFGVALTAIDSTRSVPLDSDGRAAFVELIEAALKTTTDRAPNRRKLWLEQLKKVAPNHLLLKRAKSRTR